MVCFYSSYYSRHCEEVTTKQPREMSSVFLQRSFPALPLLSFAEKKVKQRKPPGIKDCLIPGCLSDVL